MKEKCRVKCRKEGKRKGGRGERGREGGALEPVSVTACPGSYTTHILRGLLTLSNTSMLLRQFTLRSSSLFSTPTVLQSASYVVARKNPAILGGIGPTLEDTTQPASISSMEPITNILDNAASSSTTFSRKWLPPCSLLPNSTFLAFIAGVKYERVRRGRLRKDQHVCSRATPNSPFFPVLIFILISIQFLKPADLLPHEDPFRRKRPLIGPGAAESRRNDWFYQLGIDPLDEATNPQLLSYFVTDMGKMKSRAETKLTWRNQRRLTKAVRRAKMMGVMPILSKQKSSYFKDTA
jgi:ribosomal protein S18